MTASHLVDPDQAVDRFPRIDPNQDAESVIQANEWKIDFAP